MAALETRTEKIDLRVTPSAKRTLQLAALAVQRSMSEFVLEARLPVPRKAYLTGAFQTCIALSGDEILGSTRLWSDKLNTTRPDG